MASRLWPGLAEILVGQLFFLFPNNAAVQIVANDRLIRLKIDQDAFLPRAADPIRVIEGKIKKVDMRNAEGSVMVYKPAP